jgi:hypothetical protein
MTSAQRRPSRWPLAAGRRGARGRPGRWLRGRRAPARHAAGRRRGVTAEDRDHDGRPDRWVERDARGAFTLCARTEPRRRARPDERLRRRAGPTARTTTPTDGRFDAHRRPRRRRPRALHPLSDADWNTVPERWVQFNAQGQETGRVGRRRPGHDPRALPRLRRARRVTEEGVDANGDGLYEVNRIFNTRWPAHRGPPVRIERDDDRDGVYERRETYTRDGRLKHRARRHRRRRHARPHDRLFDPTGGSSRRAPTATATGTSSSGASPGRRATRASPTTTTSDYDIDRWERPGPPTGGAPLRCVTRAPVTGQRASR